MTKMISWDRDESTGLGTIRSFDIRGMLEKLVVIRGQEPLYSFKLKTSKTK